MSVPAHKQLDPMKKPGQVSFDRHPYLKSSTADQTLGQYIARKTEEPPRVTFDEWYVSMFGSGNWYSEDTVGVFRMIWTAALTRGKL